MIFTGHHLHGSAVNLTGEGAGLVMSVSHKVNLTLGTPRPILVLHSPVPGVLNLNTNRVTSHHQSPSLTLCVLFHQETSGTGRPPLASHLWKEKNISCGIKLLFCLNKR